MVEVRLHGALAKQFGMVWSFDIASPREAISAIEANSPGFCRAIQDLAKQGHCFRVRTINHDYSNDDIGLTLGGTKRIDIIPIVTGSGPGIRFVIGAALVAFAVVMTGGAALGAMPLLYGAAFGVGASLMLGSVVQWLTPVQKREQSSTSNLQSWTMTGPTNDLGQNQPVPVIYGEVLTGGYAISGGLSAAQLSAAGSVAPSVDVGGQFELNHSAPNSLSATSVFMFGAGPVNLNEPYTYSWVVSGFVGASAVRSAGHGTSSLRVEVDVDIPQGSRVGLTATVALTMTGRAAGSTSSDLVTVSVSKPITLYVDNFPIVYPESS